MKFFYSIFFFGLCYQPSFSQSKIKEIDIAITEIDNADAVIDQIWKISKKALSDRTLAEAASRLDEVVKLALEAKLKAENAEKICDEIEKVYQKGDCQDAASEADDAEDYCRHLGYHTHEMWIYTQKAIKEKEESYFRGYLNKVIGYAEESAEIVKNAKLELEDVVKDADTCKK